ncbi:MAG TPA: hypothetical protein VGS07_02325 [Thermoanaerobaculia bacterium]|jgi:hypothetical protein|nr:hypothetical protein [Thermoanaerobaculia bacterium]
MDYSLLRREEFAAPRLGELPSWDVFLSAYNKSERVNAVFEAVRADRKEWLIHPEYDFSESELPETGHLHLLNSRDEAEFWHQYTRDAKVEDWPRDLRICIDSTGFMRPHLILFPRMLRDLGFSRLDVLYADPKAYEKGESTPFTKGAVTEIRQVRGFEGAHLPDAGEEDLLVIGAGYDDELIRRVAESKRAARKMEMFGLPSLQPHMYEENRLRAALAEEALGPLPNRSLLFAPANDPFATAQELHYRLEEERVRRRFGNLYLSPLATKAQALGFALYYLCECAGEAASVIFPYAEYYSRETSVGLSRVWLYELELDWFKST